jgi:hypothetical protein
MRERLEETNRDLLHQIGVLLTVIERTTVAPELVAYREQVIALCKKLEGEAARHLRDLSYSIPDTIPDILSATQGALCLFDFVNERLAPPVIRYREEDRCALVVLHWLHNGSEQTSHRPFAVSDGSFAIYPPPEGPAVYHLPLSRRETLLYLPLLFHEYGHLLYASHRPEMDELVAEFQDMVKRVLAPGTVRDGAQARRDESVRQAIVSAWYPWLQEFFCDAVGLTLGGEAFLKAFSHYFRHRSPEEYFVPRRKQLSREHPVTYLRMRMLVDRCDGLGLGSSGADVREAWEETARLIGVREDYEGTWSEELYLPLRRTLDDMLVQASPRKFEADESQELVGLIADAWRRFESDGANYAQWEREAIANLVGGTARA